MTKEKLYTPTVTDCDTGEKTTLKTMNTVMEAGQVVQQAFGGPAHTTLAAGYPEFQTAPNEKVIGQNGASIVFGTDRKDTLVSGFGAIGLPSESMDLVVGRLASSNKGEGEDNCFITGPNFNADAARIYISRLTDVDLYFGIDVAQPSTQKGLSGVGIKADQVRIVGREGIKIVTGAMKLDKGTEANSLGGKIPVAPKIDLMAGNDVKALQPIVKGNNLNDCLLELGGFVDHNSSRIEMLENALVSVMAGLTAEPFLATTKVLGPTVTTAVQVFGKNPGYHSRINKVLWEVNYLTRPERDQRYALRADWWSDHRGQDLPAIPGAKYICSTNVRAS
jgi:hypothetical protein